MKTIRTSVAVALFAVGVCGAEGATDPAAAFRAPPQAAKAGVWWHWMGTGPGRASSR